VIDEPDLVGKMLDSVAIRLGQVLVEVGKMREDLRSLKTGQLALRSEVEGLVAGQARIEEALGAVEDRL
jgi:hypothetical protein